MGMATTVRCRTAQAFVRLGRKLHPPRRQSVEIAGGALYDLGQLMRDRDLEKPLVALGAGEIKAKGRIEKALEREGFAYCLWEQLPPEPTVDDGEKLSRAFFDEGCDCLVALGDRQVLDITKAAAARIANGQWSILDLTGRNRLRRGRLPAVFAVPTAGGSGAECAAEAVLADGSGNIFVMEDAAIMPEAVLLDPELLEDAARDRVADEGMDGLCRAIEAYLAAPAGDSAAKAWAAQAAEGFFSALEPCWNSGGSFQQRSVLLTASRQAGRAGSLVGAGYARAMIRAAMTVCGVSFREAAAVLLPAVLEKYGGYAEDALAVLAAEAAVAQTGTRTKRAEELIGRIRSMAFRMGLPDQLEGVTAEQAEEIGEIAANTANPRSISPVVWTAKECGAVVLSVCARTEGEQQ